MTRTLPVIKRIVEVAQGYPSNLSGPWNEATQAILECLRSSLDLSTENDFGKPLWDKSLETTFWMFSQFTTIRGPKALQEIVHSFTEKIETEFGEDSSRAFQESTLYPNSSRVKHLGHLVSADLLRFTYYILTFDQWAKSDLRSEPIFVEIGSGYGGFARLLKIRYPNCRIALIDLPASLAVAAAFLSTEFPNTLIHFSSELENLGDNVENWLDDGGILLLTPEAATSLRNLDADCLFNFFSLAEMENGQIKEYYNIFGSSVGARRFFSFNTIFHRTNLRSQEAFRWGNWLFPLTDNWDVETVRICDGFHVTPATMAFVNCAFVAATRRSIKISVNENLTREAISNLYGFDLFFRALAPSMDTKYQFTDYRGIGDISEVYECPIVLDASKFREKYYTQNTAIAYYPSLILPFLNKITHLFLTTRANSAKSILQLLLHALSNTGDPEDVLREEIFLRKEPSLFDQQNIFFLPPYLWSMHDCLTSDVTRNKPEIKWDQRVIGIQECCEIALNLNTSGDLTKSKELWQLIVSAMPNHGEAHHQIAWLLAEEDNLAAAVSHLMSAIQLNSNHQPYRQSLQSILRARRHILWGDSAISAQAAYDRGKSAETAGNLPVALAYFDAIVSDFPDHGAAREGAERIRGKTDPANHELSILRIDGKVLGIQEACDAAMSSSQAGNRDEAIRIWKLICETVPNHAEAHHQLAWLIADTDLPSAIELARTARRLAPEYETYVQSEAKLTAGRDLLTLQGKPVSAIEMFQRASAARRQGDSSLAVLWYETIASAIPGNHLAIQSLTELASIRVGEAKPPMFRLSRLIHGLRRWIGTKG